MNGIAKLKKGKEPPAYFSTRAIIKAKQLTEIADGNGEGAQPIVFSSGDRRPIEVSEELAEGIESVLKRTYHKAPATLVGRLETLDMHGRPIFIIYDTLTDHPVKCHFDEALYKQAQAALKERVAVSGMVRFNRRTGFPVSMKVETLLMMRDKRDLPQFTKGQYIDITGGIDPVEYIRRMRDEE